MKLKPQVRNVLIIAVLAGIVAGIGGAQSVASFVWQAVGIGFLVAFAWIGVRLYSEHRTTLHTLGTRRRTILYAAGGVGAFTLAASTRLLSTGPGTVAWIVLLGGAAYTVYMVWRSYKQY